MSQEVRNNDGTTSQVAEPRGDDAFEALKAGLALPSAVAQDQEQPTLQPDVEDEKETQEIPDDEILLDDEDLVEEVEEIEDPDEELVEVTSEDEEIIEDDDEEVEEDTWEVLTEHSQYRDKDAVIKGIEAKDAYIIELEKANDEARGELSQLSQQLSLYTDTVSTEMLETAMIQTLLPEEYRGKTEDDFEDDVEFRKFLRAESEAKLRYERQQAEAARKAEDDERRRQEAIKDSAKFVRETATTGFFGITNPEDRDRLKKVLTTKDENGHTPVDHARYITQVFGEEGGRRYLEGLRQEIQGRGDEHVAEPDETTTKSKVATKPSKRVVQKVKKKKVKVKTQITPPPPEKQNKDKFAGKDTKTIISAGLKTPNSLR